MTVAEYLQSVGVNPPHEGIFFFDGELISSSSVDPFADTHSTHRFSDGAWVRDDSKEPSLINPGIGSEGIDLHPEIVAAIAVAIPGSFAAAVEEEATAMGWSESVFDQPAGKVLEDESGLCETCLRDARAVIIADEPDTFCGTCVVCKGTRILFRASDLVFPRYAAEHWLTMAAQEGIREAAGNQAQSVIAEEIISGDYKTTRTFGFSPRMASVSAYSTEREVLEQLREDYISELSLVLTKVELVSRRLAAFPRPETAGEIVIAGERWRKV